MGALNCIPKDDTTVDGFEKNEQTQGGADGQTPQEPNYEQLQQKIDQQTKELEKYKGKDEEVEGLKKEIQVLNAKLVGQEEIDTLKQEHSEQIEEKSQAITEHNKVKRNLHLQLNQTKQDQLRAEAAASIYKRKLEEDSKKHQAELEDHKARLVAAEKQVALRGILLKINKQGHGAKVLREVLVFVGDTLQICVAEPNASSLPREQVTDVSVEPAILNGARFTAEDASKLIIISTNKKKIPFLCDDAEQRNLWFATIQSRLQQD